MGLFDWLRRFFSTSPEDHSWQGPHNQYTQAEMASPPPVMPSQAELSQAELSQAELSQAELSQAESSQAESSGTASPEASQNPARVPAFSSAADGSTEDRSQQSPAEQAGLQWRDSGETVPTDSDALPLGLFGPEQPHEFEFSQTPLAMTPWVGRRDRIPADDPRTRAIGQEMINRGLISSEELEEIHRVGARMDELRPDLAVAGELARQAVLRSREERQRIKAEKQAQAALRRREHAEAVAQRRATDIIYLGRGVSTGLANRQSQEEKLRQAELPVISTPAELAEILGLSVARLRWLAFHHEAARRTHYIRFSIPKKSGGSRELATPHRTLARCQQWILKNLLEKIPVHNAAHGFVQGRSTVTNAQPHQGKALVVGLDLKDFFPSITFVRARGFLQAVGYSPAVATIIALLCTESPRQTVRYAGEELQVATGPPVLPQGACTSPALSNLVAFRLDVRLSGLANSHGWTYTRYADDLTFSRAEADRDQMVVRRLLGAVNRITYEEGFWVNPSKTRVQRPHCSQRVTGIVVNQRVGVPRQHVRRLRAILHRAQQEGLAAQNRENIPHFEAWLRGHIAYVNMVNPSQGRPLLEALQSLSSS